MPDVTWAPEVVEKAAQAIHGNRREWPLDGFAKQRPLYRADAIKVLSASPLPEALALIERLVAARTVDDRGEQLWLGEVYQLCDDAAAFLARVRLGAPAAETNRPR